MKRILLITLTSLFCINILAQDSLQYSISIISNFSTGKFAPYMIGSWCHGKTTQKSSSLIDAEMINPLNTHKRLSYGYGAEILAGLSTKDQYSFFRTSDNGLQPDDSWSERAQGPSPFWIQQLYGEIKYRSVFFTFGMKNHASALLNNELSSGDLVESGNSRPIPEARIGFIDFQDIPYTNGWVQIQGEISYGKFIDNNYLKHHYNYYSYHLNLNALYSYKRCYFRTNPNFPLSMTIGMQVGGMFGGETQSYNKGILVKTEKFSKSLKTFMKMFLPIGENGEDYYAGSSLGSWDLHLRYRLPDNSQIIAYVEKPWEDGSGIGLRNKTDGLWGLEYKSSKKGWMTGAVFELLDFRDQGGPIHWAPTDAPGTTITTEATGRDNYYNNRYYNSYAYYGMAIGTPFLLSPLYNLDGYPAFAANRASGFHFAMMGDLNKCVAYRAMIGYQRALGTYFYPYYKPKTCTSVMFEASWMLNGFNIKGQLAYDGGSLRGNNLGMCFKVAYKFNN